MANGLELEKGLGGEGEVGKMNGREKEGAKERGNGIEGERDGGRGREGEGRREGQEDTYLYTFIHTNIYIFYEFKIILNQILYLFKIKITFGVKAY